MSWYHLSYDTIGTGRNPDASTEAKAALLRSLHTELKVDMPRLHRPTETSIIFYTDQAYAAVYSAISRWAKSSIVYYVLSLVATDSQGRNYCTWSPNTSLTNNIQKEYFELISK